MSIAPEEPEILIVDEDSRSRGAAAALLEAAGYVVFQAGGRLEALKIARKQALDLVICDVGLGGQSGLEVCRELRQDSRFSDLPVILLTGCDDFETRAAGMKLGVSEFLCKPFAHHELIARINNQLEVRRMCRQLDHLVEQL